MRSRGSSITAAVDRRQSLFAGTRLEGPGSYLRLLGLIVACLVVLYLLVGATTLWQNGSGHGKVIVNMLAQVVWITYAITQLILVVLLIMTVRHYIAKRR